MGFPSQIQTRTIHRWFSSGRSWQNDKDAQYRCLKDLNERYRAAFSSCWRLVKKLYNADITIVVMVEGDPAQNISAIRNIRLVIKGGTIFDIRSLQSELGIEP